MRRENLSPTIRETDAALLIMRGYLDCHKVVTDHPKAAKRAIDSLSVLFSHDEDTTDEIAINIIIVTSDSPEAFAGYIGNWRFVLSEEKRRAQSLVLNAYTDAVVTY